MERTKSSSHIKSRSYNCGFYNNSKPETLPTQSPSRVSLNKKSQVPQNEIIYRDQSKNRSKTPVINEKPICHNCSKLMRQETKIIDEINNIISYTQSIISSVQEWKRGKKSFFNTPKIDLKFSKDCEFESSKKIYELYKKILEISGLLASSIDDVSVLSRTSPWDLVKKNIEDDVDTDEDLISLITKARDCIASIQGTLIAENSPVISKDDMVKSLTLQLLQSHRERRALEIHQKVLPGSQSIKEITKILDKKLSKPTINT
jgi:hypothetical protein